LATKKFTRKSYRKIYQGQDPDPQHWGKEATKEAKNKDSLCGALEQIHFDLALSTNPERENIASPDPVRLHCAKSKNSYTFYFYGFVPGLSIDVLNGNAILFLFAMSTVLDSKQILRYLSLIY
jgi:hypothetical protein